MSDMTLEETQSLKTVTRGEVASHNTPEDAWMILDNIVYDVTKFADFHPGGTKLLLDYAGQDVTEVFWDLHRYDVLLKYAPKLAIAQVAESEKKPQQGPTLSKLKGQISKVPYAESSFWQGWRSPYYNDSHKAFRSAVRKFIDEEVLPIAISYEDTDKVPPKDLYLKIAQFGLLAVRLGPGRHLHGLNLPGGVKGEDFDYFHEMIAHEEMSRMCCPGFVDGLGSGLVIGLPPVMVFGNSELIRKVVPGCLRGEKIICLAISEPFAGSDVARIQCSAKKTPCGKFFIVNGVKKWITQGLNADYFTVAVRTEGGISLLLIERGEGVETKPIKTSYSGCAGTAYIIFENVKVPITNLIGEENKGFKCIMANFNHERWFIVCGVNASSRKIMEESLKWSQQRKVFGRRLAEEPVIRAKLACAISRVEGVHNWLENITYQMTKMSYAEQTEVLAGPIALLKQMCTRVAYEVSDTACQILGGRAITRSGMGQSVERMQRAIKFGAILGGSEEIMADLGIRMAFRNWPKTAKM